MQKLERLSIQTVTSLYRRQHESTLFSHRPILFYSIRFIITFFIVADEWPYLVGFHESFTIVQPLGIALSMRLLENRRVYLYTVLLSKRCKRSLLASTELGLVNIFKVCRYPPGDIRYE